MGNIYSVRVTKKALENLEKVPRRIVKKFDRWFEMVENQGIREARKIKSYHDEPLQGDRFGQRSIRLNRAYRAFYIEKRDGIIELIEVLEVNKHDY